MRVMRWLAVKSGVLWASMAITVTSMVLSGLLGLTIRWGMGLPIGFRHILVSLVIPLIIAPPFSVVCMRLVRDLDRAENELIRLSSRDPLTGVANRRAFMQAAAHEMARARRYQGGPGLVLLDVDNLKETNDGFGHPAGDMLLAEIAATCAQLCRESDTFARIGGDEFGFVLSNADQVGLDAFARRLLTAIRDLSLTLGDAVIHTTVSVGTSRYSTTDSDLSQILWRADEAMYAVKRNGGDDVQHG